SFRRRGDGRSATFESCHTPSSSVPLRTPREWRRWAKRVADLLREPFSTPDAQVGWAIPAVAAALRLVRAYRPRVLYSTGPPHSSHLIALVVKALTGIPLVIDLRDPWARCEWQLAEGSLRRHLQPWLEELCVEYSDYVILNTPSLREEFCQRY